MPKSKKRERQCQQCGKTYLLGIDSTQHKYCSETCRSKWHYNKWKSSGGFRCKHKTKAYWLKHQYGLSVEQRDSLLEKQNYSCAICKTKTTTKFGWHIDHCHTTNKVRGILCQFCNQLLGMAKNDTSILKEAISYLNESSKINLDNT